MYLEAEAFQQEWSLVAVTYFQHLVVVGLHAALEAVLQHMGHDMALGC